MPKPLEVTVDRRTRWRVSYAYEIDNGNWKVVVIPHDISDDELRDRIAKSLGPDVSFTMVILDRPRRPISIVPPPVSYRLETPVFPRCH